MARIRQVGLQAGESGESAYKERVSLTDTANSDIERNLHIARYVFASSLDLGGRVLDCACGTGYGTEILGREGDRVVIGADISREVIERARELCTSPRVCYIQADISQPGQFPRRLSTCQTRMRHYVTLERCWNRVEFSLSRPLMEESRPHCDVCSQPIASTAGRRMCLPLFVAFREPGSRCAPALDKLTFLHGCVPSIGWPGQGVSCLLGADWLGWNRCSYALRPP
jgi:SAM-dependent methyltransferase